jgi:two-component system sensor kinase FixL
MMVEDAWADPHWAPQRDLAHRLGIRACWAMPIGGSDGSALGAVAISLPRPGRPGEPDTEALETAAALAAIAFERAEAAERLRRKTVELVESDARYQALARVAPVGLWRSDAAGANVYSNERWCAIAGMPAEAAFGDGWINAVHPEDRPRILAMWSVGDRRAVQAEYRMMRPDGHVTWVLGKVVPEHDAAGRLVGYIGTVTDITALKLAEEEVRRGRNELAAILDATTDGLIIADLEQGRYVRANAAMHAMLGYDAEELTRLPLGGIFADGGPAPGGGLRRLRRRDGSSLPAEVTVQSYGFAGRRYSVSVHRDVSLRLAREARLRETERHLVAAGRLSAIGTMASGFAHELNQPLTAGANFLRAARDLLGEEGTPDEARLQLARAVLDRAGAQTLRAGEIVRRLRDFIGRGETERQPESLADLLEEAIRLAQTGRRNEGVDVRLEVGPGTGLALVDRIQVQQVMVNLARNACEAMQGQAERVLEVTARRLGRMVEVTVADNGPGLPPAVLARLFDPFITTKPDGMGIGLPICRTIVEAHGGTLTGGNRAGGGAVFRFTLPAAEPSAEATPDA